MTSMGAVATVVLLSLCFCAAVEARVFATCWLMWEGPDDLGYTYTFNQNRRALDTMLAARYPSFVIESYAATNVGSMTSDQANATVFDFIQNKQCNVILSADTYLLPYVYYEDGGTTLATMYPNVSWILIDDFRMPTRSGLPNLIWGSGSWGPPNWIAGVTAAVQAANDAVCFVSAYEDGVLSAPEAANAFILGVRAINRTKPVMLMTMNNWYWPGAEELAVSLLNKNGCRVVARYTDARLIDIWVKNHPESGMLSIGAHSDVGAYVGDSVMMSALEDNTQLIDLFVTIIETGTIGSGYFPLLLNPIFTPLSPDASVAAHTAYTWAVANAPDPNHIICGARKLRRGETVNYTQANGCLSVLERPTEYIYDAGTTYYSFANGLDCPNGTYYEYSFPDLIMTCYPCPANTYRPPEQTAAGTSCTPCPQGFISAPGATICTQPHSSSSVADVWYAFLIAGLVVVGAIAVMAARQYRAYAVFAVRPLDPDTAFAVCFLGLKNEHELQELGETNMQAALEKLNGMIRSAARKHGCFEARRIDAGTVMVVGKSATDLVLFTETVMEQVVALDWRNMVFVDLQGPAGKKRHSRIVAHSTTESTHSKHSMSKRSQHSPAQSARLKHQPQQDQVSVRSGTPSTSTRRSTALDLEAIVPTIYAGVHFGTAQIVVDDEQHTVSYHGHTITAAAGIADAAVAGQILLSSDAVEAVALESMSGKLTGSFVSSGTRMEMSVVTYQSARLSEKHHRKVAAAAARSSASEEGVLGNAIARAEGRLMRRRVAVISCHVPQLARDMRSDDRALLEAHAVIEELAEVAAANFGAVQSVQDGLVTITIGVDKAVSLLSSRAAAIAHEVEHLCSAIGMHMTVAVVGRSASGGTSILGHVASVASVMRLMAADSKVKVITTGACYGDLYPTHFLATVDALLLPWDLSGKPTRVVALRGLRESGQEDDEWLYRFDREMAAESGWTHVVEGREVTPAELEAIQSSPISFVPRSDDVAAANEPDAALLLGKKTLVELLTTTTDNALAKPLAHRLRERTEARLSSIASHALSQSLPLF